MLKISVVQIFTCAFFQKMLFLLYKLRNAFLVTNDLSGEDLPHWTYCLYFHSNYCTHSLYHFEKPAIVATKSYIFIFMHVKPIKVTSGFNLRVMKKIRQVALSYRKIKNKYEKADISTIDADPGVPRVSKDAPGST